MRMNRLLRLGSEALTRRFWGGGGRRVHDADRAVHPGRGEVYKVTGSPIQGVEQLRGGVQENVPYTQRWDGNQNPSSGYGDPPTPTLKDIEAENVYPARPEVVQVPLPAGRCSNPPTAFQQSERYPPPGVAATED